MDTDLNSEDTIAAIYTFINLSWLFCIYPKTITKLFSFLVSGFFSKNRWTKSLLNRNTHSIYAWKEERCSTKDMLLMLALSIRLGQLCQYSRIPQLKRLLSGGTCKRSNCFFHKDNHSSRRRREMLRSPAL